MRPMLFAALLVSTLAVADKPKVVLVPFGTGEGATEAQSSKFTKLVGEELKNREELELMSPPQVKEVKAAPQPAKKSGAAAEASFALEAGKKALADLKFEEAMAQLKKGIEASLSDPASCDFPSVIDATISLAAAAFRAGDEKEAKQALQTLARLDPNYALPAGYPPIFSREFEKAKKKIEKSPKGSINIDGPAGATAFVDGRDLGMVPVLEESLASGTHYVKVEGTHGEKYGQTVEVKGGVSKVRAEFKGGGAKDDGKGGVVEPRIAAALDSEAKQQVAAYTKAAGAEYALVGFVYRTGDQQLTAGPALYSVKKNGFVALLPVAFDDAVLTATVEAFKIVDGVQQRISSFGGVAELPLNLMSKSAMKVASKSGGKSGGGDDVTGVTAERKVVARSDAEKTNLEPSDGTVRKLDRKSTLVDDSSGGGEEQPPPQQEVKKGVPVWVWVVAGVAVAAGAGVGGYFGYKEATKPVTGTVTATW